MSNDITGEALQKIARLFALLVIRDVEQQQDKISLLTSIGFPDSEISDLLQVKPRAISDAKYKLKKKNQPGRKKVTKK